MIQLICENCGREFTSDRDRRFCCTRCRRSLWSRTRYAETRTPCPHNEGVICADQDCAICGWNPKVEKQRKRKGR